MALYMAPFGAKCVSKTETEARDELVYIVSKDGLSDRPLEWKPTKPMPGANDGDDLLGCVLAVVE